MLAQPVVTDRITNRVGHCAQEGVVRSESNQVSTGPRGDQQKMYPPSDDERSAARLWLNVLKNNFSKSRTGVEQSDMKHRGRKSAAEIQAEHLYRRLHPPVPEIVVDNPPYEPPPPPDDLADEEKALWRDVADEYRIGTASAMMLRLALDAHRVAREAHILVNQEGICIPNRDGNPVVHPAVRVQMREFRYFMQAMKALGVSPYA